MARYSNPFTPWGKANILILDLGNESRIMGCFLKHLISKRDTIIPQERGDL